MRRSALWHASPATKGRVLLLHAVENARLKLSTNSLRELAHYDALHRGL